jgi:hypothetical protein
MIEREAAILIYNEVAGIKQKKGHLVRVAPEGFYEVTMELQPGKTYTALLPISSTVLIAADSEVEVASIEVER